MSYHHSFTMTVLLPKHVTFIIRLCRFTDNGQKKINKQENVTDWTVGQSQRALLNTIFSCLLYWFSGKWLYSECLCSTEFSTFYWLGSKEGENKSCTKEFSNLSTFSRKLRQKRELRVDISRTKTSRHVWEAWLQECHFKTKRLEYYKGLTPSLLWRDYKTQEWILVPSVSVSMSCYFVLVLTSCNTDE